MVAMTIYVAETLPGAKIGVCLSAINLGISFAYVLSSIIQGTTLPRPADP